MTLEEVRSQIDHIDSELKALIMDRMDCSFHVAEAKFADNSTSVYRADREHEIIERLAETIPLDRRPEYIAVLRKIMEASRMYQYGLLYDWNGEETVFAPLVDGVTTKDSDTRCRIRVTRFNRPNAMSSILSMVGDYGYNMETMTFISEDTTNNTVTFDLTIIGSLTSVNMKKLMFQLSRESESFSILESFCP